MKNLILLLTSKVGTGTSLEGVLVRHLREHNVHCVVACPKGEVLVHEARSKGIPVKVVARVSHWRTTSGCSLSGLVTIRLAKARPSEGLKASRHAGCDGPAGPSPEKKDWLADRRRDSPGDTEGLDLATTMLMADLGQGRAPGARWQRADQEVFLKRCLTWIVTVRPEIVPG